MTLVLNLNPETEAWLEGEARKKNLPVSDYAVHLLERTMQDVPKQTNGKNQFALLEAGARKEDVPEIKTGADLLAYWEKIGFVGMWADREDMRDSTEWVNRQRQKRKQAIREKSGFSRENEP